MLDEKTKAKQVKKENEDRSNKMNIVKNLLDKGKKSGTLTYKEIMDELENIDLGPEQIEKIYEVLESMGIEVIGEPNSEEEVEEEALIMEELDEFGYAVDDDHSNLKNIEEDIPEYEKEE